ncbi:MAG: TonB-dependent receptor [Gemmatimonadota bacterium]|nr:TonB-dependent receptor [Gemmatimonadota bacterium]
MRRFHFFRCVVLWAIPLVAAAQEPADSAADSARRIAPVTITATRHTETLITVPLAVTVIDRKELENRKGYSLDEVLRAVPGVFAQSRYGTSDVRLVIRGFGARGAGDRSNAGTARGVRVLLDGIPETEPDGRTSFDLVDLAAARRVEVVRSNASALYGNAAGGVLDITTVGFADRQLAAASQMAGSFGLMRTVLDAGSKVGAGSVNATFTNTTQDGWRAHSSARRSLFSSSYVANPNPTTTARLFLTAANDLFHIPGPLTLAEAETTPRAANATYVARDERRYNRVGRIGVTVDRDLASNSSLSAMMFFNPKVLQRSERGTFRDFNRYHLGGNLVFRAESRLQDGIRGSTIVGADGAHQDGTILFYSLTPAGTRGTTLLDNKAEGATNTGVFVQQGLVFRDRVSLEFGARYDDIKYDYRNFITPQINAAKSFRRLTPKVGMSFLASPTHSFYANLGGGVEAPAGNETDPAGTFGQDTVTALNPLLDAIRSTTYEVGTKQLIDVGRAYLGSVSYDAALYRTEVRNEIIPYRGGRFYFTAGKVRREGAELGTGVEGVRGFSLRGSMTLSRNHYTEYIVDSVHYGSPGRTANYAGNDVAGLPDMFYGLSVAHDLTFGLPLSARLDARGVGDYFIDDANSASLPGYNTLDFTLTLRPMAMGSAALSGFVTVSNLFDRRFIGSAYTNPDIVNGAAVAYEPGTPRSVLVSLTISRQ